MKNAFLKIIWMFLFFMISVTLTTSAFAAEKTAAQQKKEPTEVIKYTDYKALTGVELSKMVQMVLKDSGFDPGPIDGIIGPKTRKAIQSFQDQNSLEPTGELDKYTLDRLFWSF
jgi:peptidoglycan hydrolase-like protein with peptidoglycan-binding domain